MCSKQASGLSKNQWEDMRYRMFRPKSNSEFKSNELEVN